MLLVDQLQLLSMAAVHTPWIKTLNQGMCDQGRGALIRMGGAPLVENRSLPFIRPLFLAILA